MASVALYSRVRRLGNELFRKKTRWSNFMTASPKDAKELEINTQSFSSVTATSIDTKRFKINTRSINSMTALPIDTKAVAINSQSNTRSFNSMTTLPKDTKEFKIDEEVCEDGSDGDRDGDGVGHIPVMVEEVREALRGSVGGGGVVLDMTFGGGGHSKALLDSDPNLRLLCLDRDPTAIDYAKTLHRKHPTRVIPLLGRFSDVPKLLSALKFPSGSLDGVLMDLGASSMQFNTPGRGFMLSQDGPLDMRMDGSRDPDQLTAGDIVGHCDEASLYKVLKYFGEEKHARNLARALVEARYIFRRPSTTRELATLVAEIIGGDTRKDKLQRFSHPATKTFQALRILVNNELNELDYGLRVAHYYLRPGGVLAALTFHSLEDTIVKRHITGVEVDRTPGSIGLGVGKHRTGLSLYTKDEMNRLTTPHWSAITRHVLLPSQEEITANPRARSAKLRLANKL